MEYEQIMAGNYWLDLIDGSAEILIMMLGFAWIFRNKTSIKRRSGGLLVCLAVFTLINASVMSIRLPAAAMFYSYLGALLLVLCLYGAVVSSTDIRNVLTLALYLCNTVVMAKTMTGMLTNGWAKLLVQYAVLIGLLLYYIWLYEEVYFEISHTYWICVMAVPVLITALWQAWFDARVGFNPFVSASIIVLDALVYFLFTHLIKEAKRQSELALTNDTLLFQIQQMDAVREQFESVRNARHELKNNYFIIEMYAEKGDYSGLREYLHSEILPSLEVKEYVSTGNDFVDMILSQKIMQAKEKNIPIKMDVAVSDYINIKQQFLAGLLFNLFDNAIEASEKIDEPDIYFHMQQDKGYLSLQIKNRIETSVLRFNPDFHTTKADQMNHGIGTRIIRRIVDSCDGNLDYREENSYFIVTVMLPLR